MVHCHKQKQNLCLLLICAINAKHEFTRAELLEFPSNTTTNKVFVESPNNDPSTENQGVDVLGLGIKGGTYKAKVRSVGENGFSDWTAAVQFTMTAADEGTVTDPEKPATVTGVTLHGMLNAMYLTINDETLGTKQAMSGNRGKYEIQVSNASGGFNETTGNEWSKNIDSNGVAGNTSTAALVFIVPTGQGFICTGLRSESGGRPHYVRVRGINWGGDCRRLVFNHGNITRHGQQVSGWCLDW